MACTSVAAEEEEGGGGAAGRGGSSVEPRLPHRQHTDPRPVHRRDLRDFNVIGRGIVGQQVEARRSSTSAFLSTESNLV